MSIDRNGKAGAVGAPTGPEPFAVDLVTTPLTIAVIGATGVLGRHTVPRLLESGHRVNALVRREEDSWQWQQTGAKTFVGDIFEPLTLRPLLEGCDVALHLATAVPRAGQPLDFSRNDRIRREGTNHLLQACKVVGVF